MRSLLIVIFSAIVFLVNAQTPLSLENAILRAAENNMDIRSGNMQADYRRQMTGTARMIDPLNITGEFGQVNSAYFDQGFSVSQAFKLPAFYKANRELLTREMDYFTSLVENQKWKLRRELSLIYNELVYLDEKEKLLQQADSTYANYARIAKLRLDKGESNMLESTSAHNLSAQARLQLQSIRRDREVLINQFNLLINDGTQYINEKNTFNSLSIPLMVDTAFTNSILLQNLRQQQQVEIARLNLEKTRLLPDFEIGYNNNSFYGTGPDDKFYNYGHRFHSGSVGLRIPVFRSAQRAAIKAQEMNVRLSEYNYAINKKYLRSRYEKLMSEHRQLSDEINYYRAEGLNNAQSVIQTAQRLYSLGEINYLEWSILVGQSFEIQNKYLDALRALNEKTIELNAMINE